MKELIKWLRDQIKDTNDYADYDPYKHGKNTAFREAFRKIAEFDKEPKFGCVNIEKVKEIFDTCQRKYLTQRGLVITFRDALAELEKDTPKTKLTWEQFGSMRHNSNYINKALCFFYIELDKPKMIYETFFRTQTSIDMKDLPLGTYTDLDEAKEVCEQWLNKFISPNWI